jgi:hypothetical protein
MMTIVVVEPVVVNVSLENELDVRRRHDLQAKSAGESARSTAETMLWLTPRCANPRDWL